MDRLGETGDVDVRSLQVSRALLLIILLAFPVAAAGEVSPEADKRNTVRLQSQPSVEILWEGVPLGRTDAGGILVIEGIPSGEYRLTLRKQGFHQLDLQIKVEEGTSSSRAHFLEAVRPHPGPQATSKEATSQQTVSQQTVSQQAASQQTVSQQATPPKVTAESRVVNRESTVPVPAKRPNDDVSPSTASSDADSQSNMATTGAPAENVPRSALSEESETTVDMTDIASGLPFSPFLGVMALLLALLAGAAGARFLPRSRKVDAPAHLPLHRGLNPLPSGDEMPLFEDVSAGPASPTRERDIPGFLEDLKQRERDFGDALDTPTRRREETIIEVEAVEVIPAAARPTDEAS